MYNKLQGFIEKDNLKVKTFNLYEKGLILESDNNIYGKKRKN